jgi:hypothetical protein
MVSPLRRALRLVPLLALALTALVVSAASADPLAIALAVIALLGWAVATIAALTRPRD